MIKILSGFRVTMLNSDKERRHRDEGMYLDSLHLNHNEVLLEDWIDFALKSDNLVELADFVYQYLPGHGFPKTLHDPIRGSYNMNWRLEFDDGFSALIHIPTPHRVAFPDEKIRAEVAAMRLIREHTTIPVPEVYHWGTSSENPTGYGPFIIMEYIEHHRLLEHVISDEGDPNNGLRRDLSDETLLKAYRQMANIMLQLSTIEGSAIGFPALSNPPAQKRQPSSASPPPHQSQARISRVHSRHISHHMNDLVIGCGLPTSVLPPSNSTYRTSQEYYQAMADLSLSRLAFQRNNAVLSPPDGREKYVARQLFRKLARDGRPAGNNAGRGTGAAAARARGRGEVFKLWCDDMRPTSVLLDDNDDVVGVIDWEMSYFAPASFHDDPPWWLLAGKPEFWNQGLGSWVKEYERRLPLFLKAMELEVRVLREAGGEAKHDLGAPHRRLELSAIDEVGKDGSLLIPMSKRMQQAWEDGDFFMNYIARRGDALDPIYWRYIDKKLFGMHKKVGTLFKKGGYKGRLHLLSEKERAQMEPFVTWKMEDSGEEKLVDWDERDAQVVLAACLGGTLGEIDIPKPRVVQYTRRNLSSSPSPPRDATFVVVNS